jgi:hypothetical protein
VNREVNAHTINFDGPRGRRIILDESRYIDAMHVWHRDGKRSTRFMIHNGMCATRIALSDEAVNAMYWLARELSEDAEATP